jgi:hypothetical protein
LRRHPRLRGLSDDHHTALVLAIRCKRADVETLPALWASLQEISTAHLEPHFLIEEQHLLPALEQIGEHAMAKRIGDEHARLRALTATAAPTAEIVLTFGQLLEAHVRYEEREVFERTQDRLPEETLAEIERICEEVPRVCPVGFFSESNA